LREIGKIGCSGRISGGRLESIEGCEGYGSEDGDDRDGDNEFDESETMTGFKTNPLNPPYQGEIITPPLIRGGWEGFVFGVGHTLGNDG